MPLRGPRFSGDPVLEECFQGRHRMMAPEEGLAVKRVQAALIELGHPVGPAGADGIFGPATGSAVTDYKTRKGLTPNDPVVGAGTSKALDDDLFFDPPILDPAFAEFSPAVVDHRVEPFVALELAALHRAPLDSWRHMLGRFALDSLNTGRLLGIVAHSRALGLRDRFVAVADASQPGGQPAEDFFDDALIPRDDAATTFTFFTGGQPRAFVLVKDVTILGRESIVRTSNGTRAPVTLQGVVVHELIHVRNLGFNAALADTEDTDTSAFADTALAQARSAAAGPSADVVRRFVTEVTARHVHWILLQELAGTPGSIAVMGLSPGQLVAAARFYLVELTSVYDSNGYGAGITAQGAAAQFRQLELWLRLCAAQTFSDDPAQDQQPTLLFEAAAQFCAAQVANPTPLPQPDGLFPLEQDFR